MRFAVTEKLKCTRDVRSWLRSKKNKQYTVRFVIVD